MEVANPNVDYQKIVDAVITLANGAGLAPSAPQTVLLPVSGVSVAPQPALEVLVTADLTNPTTYKRGTIWLSVFTRIFQLSTTASPAAANWMPMTNLATVLDSTQRATVLGYQNSAPTVICTNAVPLVLPSSGSIANNGALTLTTALPRIFPRSWMYFPAGAIASGSAAGTYYVEMSSTTAGIIYNNALTTPWDGNMGTPSLKVAFVTTGPGAYTQTVSADFALHRVTVKANSLGANGSLDTKFLIEAPNNANVKSFKVSFGGTQFALATATSMLSGNFESIIQNVGATNIQIGSNSSTGYTSSAIAPAAGAVDTTADQDLTITANMATATDFMVVSRLLITATR